MNTQVPPKISEENTNEQWRPVLNGYYEVSDAGRVRRVSSRRILRQHFAGTKNNQYYSICACINGQKKTIHVHALVAEAFLGPRPLGLEVNHKDLNKLNNRIGNLEYLTRSQNALHAMAHLGPWQQIPQNEGKLSKYLEQIRQMRQSGMYLREIGEHFGVSFQAIQQRLQPRNARK